MKRIAAATALLLVLATPGIGLAATLRPSDSDGLNLRSGPGTSYQVVGTLAAGQSLKVLDSQNGWFKVKTASGQEAWAIGTYSRVSYEDEQAYGIVNTDVLNLRTDPSMNAAITAVLKQDERVRLLEIYGVWWKVTRSNGDTGWVNGTYMKRDTGAVTPPPTTPTTPPVTPPTPPAPPAPEPAETPAPAAPAGTVPVLPVLPLPPATPLGSKTVTAVLSGTVYTGRNATAFDPVDKVKPGEKLKYLGAAEGWVKVQTPRGLSGWLVGSAVAVSEGKLTYALREGSWTLNYGGAVPAPAADPAPAAPTTQPAQPALPDSVKNLEHRIVSDPDGLNLRTADSIMSNVITVLPKGTVMAVTDYSIPWIKVVTTGGQVGWVNADYTAPYTDPLPEPAPAPAPTPAPPPVAATGSVSARLSVVSAGVLELDVTSTGPALGEPKADGNTITVPVSTGETGAYNLPVASAGAQALNLTAAGLTLNMDTLPNMQVVDRTPGHVLLRLRSVLTGIAMRTQADRTIYDFTVTGPVTPTTRVSGADVIVEFPGAGNALVSALPDGVRDISTEKSTQVAFNSKHPYALKRTATGFELDLYQPGLAGKTIVLDPGHGGGDPGAVKNGLKEKDVNLQMALRLRAALAAKGANVLMTRSDDQRSAPAAIMAQMPDDPSHADLGYRSRIANELKADAFVSIHQNCCSGNGTEGYYTSWTLNGDRSATLANLLVDTVAAGLSQRNRGTDDDLMYVTRTNDVPAMLLEVEFLSDATEGLKAGKSAYQEQVAALMVQAFEKFYADRP